MPSLVPHTWRNTVRSTRNALPQPPANVYIPSVNGNDPLESTIRAAVYLPPFGNIHPLDHTSPHEYPPASFVLEVAACAASPANTLEDDDEEEGINLKGTFNDLIGKEASGLDDLTYSSAEDDDDYDDAMEEEACQIEYSNCNNALHGRQQINFIPGGPKPPSYDGMSKVEKVFTKNEYKKERKKYTDGLRMKRLKDLNDDYEVEYFSCCLTPVLRPMSEVLKCRLEVDHTFPDREILAICVAEEVNLRGINAVCSRSDLREFKCTSPRFSVMARHSERVGWHVSIANVSKCDEFGASAVVDVDAEQKKIASPFRTKWIVPLIFPIILDTPAISNKNL